MFPTFIGCSLIIYLTLTSRDHKEYNGDYPKLYSVAINSLPGAIGYIV